MRIEWTIEKKRGNLRPVLLYQVLLEEHEKALALPAVQVVSTIPKPLDFWESHCYPGRNERSGKFEEGCYSLNSPGHKEKGRQQTLRLPWREDNQYPEVEESFAVLRSVVEAQLTAAYESVPMSEQGELTTSSHMKVKVAPDVLARRLLQLAG